MPAGGLGVAAPLGELLEVLGPGRGVHRVHQREHRAKHPPGIADDRHLDRDVLADLGGVDVHVDDPGVRRIGPHVAGDPVVEAHPDGEQQVGRLDRLVDVLPAVHAHVAVAQGMGLVDRPDAQQGVGHGDLGLLGKGDEVVPGPGVQDAMTGEDHRTLGPGDLRGRELELAQVPVHVRPEARQAGDDLLVAGVRRVGLLLERVLGDVDVNRAGTTASGDVEGFGEDAGQVVRVADQVVVLGHRQRDAVDVDLLERVLADQRGRHVARDGHHRHAVELGRADARDEVRRAGTGGAHAHADLARGAGEAVGSVRAALLVPDEDVADLRVVPQDVVQGQDHAAGIAEEGRGPLADQGFADHVGTDPGPTARLGLALVEHLLAGLLDGERLGGPVVRHVRTTDRWLFPRWLFGIALREGHAFGPFPGGAARSPRERCVGIKKPPPFPARVPSVFGGPALSAPDPPRSSVLPPGAGNEAKKADKTKPKRAKYTEERYVDQTRIFDRDLDAPTVARQSDGHVASIPIVEQAQRSLPSRRTTSAVAGSLAANVKRGTTAIRPGARPTPSRDGSWSISGAVRHRFRPKVLQSATVVLPGAYLGGRAEERGTRSES